MEAPLRRFGYKPIIVGGGLLVFVSLLLFPLMEKYCVLVHIKIVYWHWGSCIHFSTQTWITSFSPQQRLGRNIAIYGLSFGVGFAAGPLFVPLVDIFEGLPFIVSGILCMLAWSLVFKLKNDFPDVMKGKAAEGNGFCPFQSDNRCRLARVSWTIWLWFSWNHHLMRCILFMHSERSWIVSICQ